MQSVLLVHRKTSRSWGLGQGEIHWAQESHENPLAAKPLYKIEVPDRGTLFIKGPDDKAFLRMEKCDCGKESCIGAGRECDLFHSIVSGEKFIIVKLNANYWVHIPQEDILRVVREAVHAFETPVAQRPPAS